MENKHLIDLSIRYGLSSEQLSKLASLMYQVGITDPKSPEFAKASAHLCESKMLDLPAEEVVEELKQKGLIGGAA